MRRARARDRDIGEVAFQLFDVRHRSLLVEPLGSGGVKRGVPGSSQFLSPRQLFSTWVAASGSSSCFCGLPRLTASLARAQIDEYVLDVTHDVAIGAERRHDVFLRRVYVLAPVNDNVGEVGIVLRLQVAAERGRVTRSFAVRAMTDVAIGVIGAEP